MSKNGEAVQRLLNQQAAAEARAALDPWQRTVFLAPLGNARGAISIMGGSSPDGTGWVRLISDHEHGTDVIDLIVEDPDGNRIADLIADGIKQATIHAETGLVQPEPKQGPSGLITP